MPIDQDSGELLCAIARQPSERTTREIVGLTRKVRDWNSLLNAAEEHRVASMLYLKLRDLAIPIPAEVQDRLKNDFERNALQSFVNAAELIDLLTMFGRAGIEAMPFKGIVLGASAYHNLSIRPAGDLDLLIRYKDLLRTTALLKTRGFELKTPVNPDGTPEAPDYFEYHFERPADGIVIELRWRLELTQPRFRRNLGMDWVWPYRRITELAGSKVPDIQPEILLLVLCMHACKHVWSRLIWICDVAQLLRSEPSLNWNLVIDQARQTGLSRSLVLGVLLAHRVAGAEIPQRVLQRFRTDRTANKLAIHVQKNLFIAPGSTPRSRIPYNIQLLGIRDRIALAGSLRFLKPNERDRAMIHLPQWLRPLYYLIRPYRILRDRSAR